VVGFALRFATTRDSLSEAEKMSRSKVLALLSLWALALSIPAVFAQVFQSGNPNTSTIGNEGRITNDPDVQQCQGTAGGSRMRENCETETETVRAEKEVPILIALPVLTSRECSATTTTEYMQLNTIARVNSTLKIADCTVASGAFSIALRVRDESGAEKPVEFDETWQRGDDQDVKFAADYPIGENAELLSVRMRRLSCTCADEPAPAEVGSE
jgi:hypothetical protein